MKSEVDLELLGEYLDGDVAAEDALFARYDREITVPDELWAAIESQIVPVAKNPVRWWMGIAAGLVLSVGFSSLLLVSNKSESIAALKLPEQRSRPVLIKSELSPPEIRRTVIKQTSKPIHVDNPGVLSTDLDLDLDEQETAKHIEQTETLLRSIRNVPVSDSDDEVDVSYDKALSRRLLIENVVLRRDAEMKAKFPTKTLLADLEPFLLDIANLPDRAKPEDLRAIKNRVQKTEIVAALVDYQDRGVDKR